jgi:asparagine synthetase (glutamine-hydrolyzing)
MAHERLAIVDVDQGAQPLYDEEKQTVLTVNGEIYNHLALRKQFSDVHYRTNSDCEPILHLFKIVGKECVHMLDGVFAFVVSQTDQRKYFAARDPIGVNPLYYGYGEDGSFWFSSEIKSIAKNCKIFKEFPPGHFWTPEDGFVQWYTPVWFKQLSSYQPLDLAKLRNALEESVAKRLMCDVP